MSEEMRSFRKSKHINYKKRFVIAIMVLLITGLGIRVFLTLNNSKYVPKEEVITVQIVEPENADSEISGQYYGLCAKNTVHTVEDFYKTVKKDPILTAHFSDFDWSIAKIGKQDEEIWTFVSYRKDAIIKRTSKPVKLPKGDLYITDGSRIVRTYCCNDYIAAPAPRIVAIVVPNTIEPPIERVDAPTRRYNKGIIPTIATDIIPQYSNIPTDYFVPITGSIPPISGSRTQVFDNLSTAKSKVPIVTPEPSTFILMIVGLVILVYNRKCLVK